MVFFYLFDMYCTGAFYKFNLQCILTEVVFLMGFLDVDSTANIYNIYKHTVTIVLINNCARFSLQFVIPDAE